MLITTADAPGLDALSGDMDVLAFGEGVIDWPAVLAELAARGLTRVLCEGGPTLHGTLVAPGPRRRAVPDDRARARRRRRAAHRPRTRSRHART